MDLVSSVYADLNYYADLSVIISIFCQISTINGLMNHFFGDNIPFYKSIMLQNCICYRIHDQLKEGHNQLKGIYDFQQYSGMFSPGENSEPKKVLSLKCSSICFVFKLSDMRPIWCYSCRPFFKEIILSAFIRKTEIIF